MAKEKDTHTFIFYTFLSLPAEGGLKHKDTLTLVLTHMVSFD